MLTWVHVMIVGGFFIQPEASFATIAPILHSAKLFAKPISLTSRLCSTAKKTSGPWYDLYFKQYDVPENARYGCMVPISQKQYDAIRAAYRD